jgi:predicted enzyme related to lactoylglutathione lyase
MGKETNGKIVWQDLTVENADTLRDFYASVAGWSTEACDMGDYSDYNMIPADGSDAVAGICHARGGNSDMPAQWLLYVSVEDIDESIRRAVELGGEVVNGPRAMGKSRFCVIRDPAGAVMGLIE